MDIIVVEVVITSQDKSETPLVAPLLSFRCLTQEKYTEKKKLSKAIVDALESVCVFGTAL